LLACALLAGALLATVLLVGVTPRPAAATASTGQHASRLPAPDARYAPPLAGHPAVVRGFAPPASRYGAGHLGVDLSAASGDAVLAAGAGTVRFAGMVAGRGVVVLQHPDGVSTEYEPLGPVVRSGDTVSLGQPIGRLSGTHPGCPSPRCLHWGARRGGSYLDPMLLLRPLGVVRLLPWRGPPGRAVTPADGPG
jgi:murein DD-endopeptidase MepM/ murein hydrolase activator NlpD